MKRGSAGREAAGKASGHVVPSGQGEERAAGHPALSAWTRVLVPASLIVAYALLVLLRVPAIVVRGRFWAEEGSMYFASAFAEGFWRSVVAPDPGYYALFANVATAIAAHGLSVEQAPRLTVLTAFLVQLLPAVLIVTATSAPFDRLWTRIIALALVLCSPPSQEILLTTVGSQFHMLLCAVLVLILPVATGARRIGLVTVLCLAGASGIGANLLVPLFWLRAYRERSASRAEQAGALTLCAIAQGAIVLIAPSYGFVAVGHAGRRAFSFDPWITSHAIFAKQMLLPLGGARLTDEVMQPLATAIAEHRPSIAVPVAAIAWLLGLGVLAFRGRQGPAWLLYVASVWLAVISGVASVEAVDARWHLTHVSALGAGRYYYVPNVCLGLALLALSSGGSGLHQGARRGLLVLVMWILAVGAYEYARSRADHGWFFSGPDWQAEVAAWRAAPQRDLEIWPVPWRMTLRSRPGGVR